MFLLAFSIFFYFFPLSTKLPPEISLSFPGEIFIIKKAILENWKNFFLGTGPATFVFSYSKYRPQILNRTIFWGTRFQKGACTFLDLILTRGFLGSLSFSLFLIFLALSLFKKLKTSSPFFVFLACSSFGTILSFFLYPFNLSLYFLFFFLLAISALYIIERKILISPSLPSLSLFFNFLFFFALLFSLSLIFWEGKVILASSNHYKSLKFFKERKVSKAIHYLERATQLDPVNDILWRDLSQTYLLKANLISQDDSLSEKEKGRLANEAIVKGGEAINRAVKIAPFNVANWNVRGFFYGNLIGVKGAESIALYSYQRAIELEPTSPYPFEEKGRIYILLAQNAKEKEEKEKNLNLAIENLKKSLNLKPDYAPAHYLLAIAYDQLGKTKEAILKLEDAKNFAPLDFGLAFQLGILYWREGDIEKAKAEFERALQINPNYLNAKYMLGIIFDQKGEKEKAEKLFKEILKAEPENEEVRKILENMEKGVSALEGLKIEKPLQTFPPEIKR